MGEGAHDIFSSTIEIPMLFYFTAQIDSCLVPISPNRQMTHVPKTPRIMRYVSFYKLQDSHHVKIQLLLIFFLCVLCKCCLYFGSHMGEHQHSLSARSL